MSALTQIDKSKPVLLTGATGYVAGWLVKKLLEEGFTVHAAVRNPNNREKLAHLDAIAQSAKGTIRYFASELLEEGSYAAAMEGCELIFHTASPFTSKYKDPQKELIDPALKGTINVLEQANKTPSIKRVVLTSSCVTMYGDNSDLEKTPKGLFTEEMWNTTSSLHHRPYSCSKTLAEKKAWEMASQQQSWDLITINPSLVMGPALSTRAVTSDSFSILKQMGDGTLRFGTADIGTGIVDVRDVAEAHFQAGFLPSASGRYIINAHNSSLLEIAKILHAKFGDKYPVPRSPLPKWLLLLVGRLFNKELTPTFIRRNLNKEWKADNTKSIKELGITYRLLEETMEDAFRQLIDEGIIKKRWW